MVTLSEALNAFLMQREVDSRSKRTLGFYQGKIEIFIAFVGDKVVKDLTIQEDGISF